MSAETKLTARSALSVLRNGPFRRYVIGSLISDTGSWMQVMAQGWVMATLTDKAIWLGMANLAAGLPMLLLTMVGGAAADRFDKRKILLITQFIQIATACGIGFLVLKGRIEIWEILAFAVVLGISNSFEMPTQSALVPELVGRSQIQNGISIDRSVFHGSRVLGPTIGGYLINWLGKASAFFANALSFVALIIAIWSLPPRPKGTAEEEEKRSSGIKDGFRFVFNDAPSLAMVTLIAVQSFCIFPIITVMMPLYVKEVLHRGADSLGSLMGVSAIGSFVGSIFLIGLPRAKRVSLMMINAVAVSMVIVGISCGPSFYLVMALLVVNSLALAMNFALCSTIVQERAPDYLRGRVSAVFMLSFVGMMPFAGLGVTSLSDFIGMKTALAIAAIVYGAITILVLLRVRRECALTGECQAELTTPGAGAGFRAALNRVIAFSTSWNSSRHTDGAEMLREIKDLGFNRVELGHGIRISLMPGIQKMFDAGEVEFTSLHNFCPLPVEIMQASPDCYKISAAYSKERDRAIRHTFQTIDFAQRLGAPFVVLHCGEVEMNPITDELIALAKNGEHLSREYVRLKVKAVQTREAAAPPYLERVKDALKRIAEYAEKKNVRLGVEGRRGYEEIPSERELPALLDELNSPQFGYWHDMGHLQIKENLGFVNHAEWLRQIGPRAFGCHLQDCKWPGQDHQAPFTGMVDLDNLVPLLPANCLFVWEMSPRRTADEIRLSVTRWKERFGE